MQRIKLGLSIAAIAAFCFVGCDNKQGGNAPSKPNSKTAGQTGDHDHDHDHADEAHDMHGPNDGHPFKLTPADFQAEWTHSSTNNIIKIFVLDADGKANKAVKADSVIIRPVSGNNADPFKLDPVAPNEQGETAEYMRDDKQLALAMTLGVKVEIKIGEKTYTGEIEAHAPHDH